MAKIVELEIVGPNAGKDMTIAGHEFIKGKSKMALSEDKTIHQQSLNLLSMYGAYVVGSKEHEDALDAWDANLASQEAGGPAGNLQTSLEDFTNKELKDYAFKKFNGAVIVGNKAELISQIVHLQKQEDEKTGGNPDSDDLKV